MTDPLRISSSDGKIPDLSARKDYDRVVRQIRLMEPSTAYVMVQGILVPILHRLHNSPDLSVNDANIQFSSINSKNITEITTKIDSIKDGLKKIQDRMKELGENYQKIMDNLGKDKLSSLEDWIIEDKYEWQDWRRNKGWFGRFVTAREFIKEEINKIREQIKQLSKSPIENSFVKELKQLTDDIENRIPDPSNRWDKKTSQYDGKEWRYPGSSRDNYSQWNLNWEGDDYNKNKSKNVFAKISNPLGLLEMTQDSKKFEEYMSILNKGLKKIDKFYESKEILFLKLGTLDTQSAYMYLITVILPALQNESAEALEKQGETMKLVSKVYDKWNELQDEITRMTKSVKSLQEKGLLKDGKLDISVIEDYSTGGKNYKIVAFDDPDRVFEKMFEARDAIEEKANEVKELLQSMEGRLPPSAKSLIDTMKELAEKASITSKDYNFYYYKDSRQVRFEVLADKVTLKDNTDYDAMNKFIIDHTKESFGFFVDPDQTKFKSYMDTIAQGITALTSISNMTQQELQIATQYHNSLLGLQKNALDSLSKVIQVATRNPNH